MINSAENRFYLRQLYQGELATIRHCQEKYAQTAHRSWLEAADTSRALVAELAVEIHAKTSSFQGDEPDSLGFIGGQKDKPQLELALS